MTASAALLPYQARWAGEDAALAVYRKSRRIGISYATAYMAVRHAGIDDVVQLGLDVVELVGPFDGVGHGGFRRLFGFRQG